MRQYKIYTITYRAFILFILLFCFNTEAVGQKKESKQKVEEKKDSLIVYKKLKKFAYKYKITKMAYDAVFVDPEPEEYPIQAVSNKKKNINPYLKYQGSIIKDINIIVYDPFGHNVNDTIRHNINTSQKFGNSVHVKTRSFVVINKLLFKVNDSINALALSETERILRDAVFVNDARIYITQTNKKDSVTVNVVVHDKWPISVPILITDVFVDAKFKNNNLFGAGQQFEQYGKYKRPDNFEFSGLYSIANIDNTYISSTIGYRTAKDETNMYLSFDRGFFSPLTTWAGGASVGHKWKTYPLTDTIEGTTKNLPLNSYNYDLWLGKSFKLVKLKNDNSLFNQSTNFIVGGRYYTNQYIKRPGDDIDSLHLNYNSAAALGNICFAVQQYYKDKYIYRFGANEDVPEGIILQFIYGGIKYERKKIRYYTGFEIARAKHFKFGYLSATLAYGIFFNERVANDITTNYKMNYFSDLLKKDNWFFREFLNFNFVHGENKLANETVVFNSDELYGFENKSLTGQTKMTLNSETVAYLPYHVIGFSFAPVITIGVGMMGSPTQKLLNSNLYQSYTIGLMLRNENLLSSTFQFAVGAYPFFPDGGGFSLKYNPIATFTLRVRSFSVSRPTFVSY